MTRLTTLPRASRNRRKSAVRSVIVAVLTFGWNPIRSVAGRSASRTTITSRDESWTRPNGETAPGVRLQVPHQPVGGGETELVVAELGRQRAAGPRAWRVPARPGSGGSLLVPEEQVLAVRGRDVRPVALGLLHGEHRRVLEPLPLDPHRPQRLVHGLFGSLRHRLVVSILSHSSFCIASFCIASEPLPVPPPRRWTTPTGS